MIISISSGMNPWTGMDRHRHQYERGSLLTATLTMRVALVSKTTRAWIDHNPGKYKLAASVMTLQSRVRQILLILDGWYKNLAICVHPYYYNIELDSDHFCSHDFARREAIPMIGFQVRKHSE
jgi:hypothetical protein